VLRLLDLLKSRDTLCLVPPETPFCGTTVEPSSSSRPSRKVNAEEEDVFAMMHVMSLFRDPRFLDAIRPKSEFEVALTFLARELDSARHPAFADAERARKLQASFDALITKITQ
jgi:hypothetical protein